MGFRLTIEQGKGQGQSFDFDGPEISIGRAEENDVVLVDNGISRRHCTISLEGDRWVLRDLGTSNGSLLNGSRVSAEPLETGDRIGLGPIVFRFEAAAQEGATRIVSLQNAPPPPPKGASNETRVAAASSVAAPAEGEPSALSRFLENPRNKKLLIAGGVLLVALLVGVKVAASRGGARDIEDCPDPVVLKDGLAAYSFGANVTSDCNAGEQLNLSFSHLAGTRAILHYAPFYADKGELELLVNDVKVADVPIALKSAPVRQELVLPDRALIAGQENTVSFRAVGGDGTWGVKYLSLDSINLKEADLAKAQEAYELGTRRYRERNIAAPNLYAGWEFLKEARRYMEGLDPKPPIYQPTLQYLRDMERDLDKLCKERMFKANQAANYGKHDMANEHYRFLISAFPGKGHPCREEAEGLVFTIDSAADE